MRITTLEALFPKVRQRLLTEVLLQSDKWWYLSELANKLGLTPSSLQRELAALLAAEILESREEGNRIYYRAQMESPGIYELKKFFEKTAGIEHTILAALEPFLPKLESVFIFGSVASGEHRAHSDVDLMLIGETTSSELTEAVRQIENKLDREVDLSVFSSKEFRKRIENDDAFIKTVMKNKKIFLKGNESELAIKDRKKTTTKS